MTESNQPTDESTSGHIGRTTRSAFTGPGTRIGRPAPPTPEGPTGAPEPGPTEPAHGRASRPDVAALDSMSPDASRHTGSRPADGALLALKIVLAAWLTLVFLSVAVPALTPSSGDGFTRGLDRLYPFLGYQALASGLGFVAAYFSRSVRRTSRSWAVLGLVPLAVLCLVVLGIIVILVLAHF